jgi:hypothetical protein
VVKGRGRRKKVEVKLLAGKFPSKYSELTPIGFFFPVNETRPPPKLKDPSITITIHLLGKK